MMHSVVLGFLVLAESVCLITGHFDLTIESIMVFSGIFGGWLISTHAIASGIILHPVIGILCVLCMGALIGAINGFFVSYVGVNPFITTLAMSIIFAGISIFITKGRTIYPLNPVYNVIGRGRIVDFPIAILFFIFSYFVMHIILTYTPFGRKLYIIGGNRFAAKASGVNVKLMILSTYILSGLLSACAGWVLTGRLNAASPQMSSGFLLIAFAAAVIGGVNLSGGEGKAIGMLGGVLLMSSISNLMNLARIDPYLIHATTGIIILVAMIINTVKRGRLFNT
jgi:ribose/xylose/arabinose/galactoside ABC-type transport system permease subunit